MSLGAWVKIHHTIDDQRRRLEFFGGALLKRPLQSEILHIFRGDLGKRAVSLTRKSTTVGEPILRLLFRIQQTVIGDLCIQNRNAGEQKNDGAKKSHALFLLLATSLAHNTPT